MESISFQTNLYAKTDWKDGKELLLWAKAVSRASVKAFRS